VLLSWAAEGGAVGGPGFPLEFEILSKKFFSFEWEKTNFTSFGPSWKKLLLTPIVTMFLVINKKRRRISESDIIYKVELFTSGKRIRWKIEGADYCFYADGERVLPD